MTEASGPVRAAPRIVAAVAAIIATPTPALATDLLETAGLLLHAFEFRVLAPLVLTIGVVVFAVTVAIQLVRTRRAAALDRVAARAEIAALRAEADRTKTLLELDPQIVAVWGGASEEPEITGHPEIVGAAFPLRVLAFGSWLGPERARDLERAVERLRAGGESFALSLVTRQGRVIESEGRAIGGRAVLRLREVTGARLEAAECAARLQQVERDAAVLRTLVETLPVPLWTRDGAGALTWANTAYALAVDAKSGADAVARRLELMERADRLAAEAARTPGTRFARRVGAVVAGERLQLDIVEVSNPAGASAGIALDATEVEKVRAGLQQTVAAHRRTLDGLATGVAIYDRSKRLVFYNAAFRRLFDLDAAFLDERPSDPDVLDRLRLERKLPEQADFRKWRDSFLACYQDSEPHEHAWHLPGGRMLRVVSHPAPDGGMTYLYDDITERIDLESRYNRLTGLHRETLDSLAEAVAVFGSDGRLKLHNPAFLKLWKLSPDSLDAGPHIETVADWCAPLGATPAWGDLRATVTAIGRHEAISRRVDRADGSVLDVAAVKLPDGSTLVTFRDVSDSVAVERGLVAKNLSLEQTDALKSRFIRHVSYELRAPLTNIIGFAQLLGDTAIGELNAKQRDYVGHITVSSAALLAIIDDILDLATIDAGVMTLEPADIDIGETMRAAADGVQDRIAEAGLTLSIEVAPGIGSVRADGKRVRQVLYNLLSNAVGFSPPGGRITLSARADEGGVAFTVADQGPGIPSELMQRVFERFESHALGSRHRGAGLGLAIVRSLVELHGGEVKIDSVPGRGTTVVAHFPAARMMAAE